MPKLPISSEELGNFCQRHHIARLSLFGSVLHGSDHADSDVDLLVEFTPDHVPGLLGLAAIEADLTSLVGRRVDLRTLQDLSPHFRADVSAEAEVQFAA